MPPSPPDSPDDRLREDPPPPPVVAPGAWLQTAEGQELPLHGECRIGRGPDNHIVIAGQKASRHHALLHAQGTEFWLMDFGSLNGTYRNERRLTHPTRLRDGDRIVIAGTHFLFRQPAGGGPSAGTVTKPADDATAIDFKEQDAWLLIADMESFTQMSQDWPAEKLAVTVGGWHLQCRHLIAKHGGRIAKYLGDGFLACWGAADADTAGVAAAVRDLQALRTTGDIRFRVAVHRGCVTFGGAVGFGEEDMISPEMNYIFRLEDLASDLGLAFCASAAAHPQLAPHLPLQLVDGEFELKSFPGRHRCYAIG